MADAFNNHFCPFPTKLLLMWLVHAVPASEYMDKFCDGTAPSLECVLADVEAVSLIISSLCIQKASGADGLPTQFIRASPQACKCINSSSVPYQWKQAIVTPVPKYKHCTRLSHFRPISVLPVLSNVCCIIRFTHIL